MCAELEISESRAAEAELRRGFERIRDFCTVDYFPQGTMDTAIPGYEALLAGNPLEFEDPEGNCRLFFEIFHCGEKRLLELIREHNDVFDNAAAALNSHFLAGIKGPGYESEMEHRLILTADRTFKDLYECDRGLRDVFEHDMRMTGNGAVERHKMTFPAEALVRIVTGPNCELTYGELDLFCSLKGRRYPNLTRDSFVRSQNAIR